jgi:sulfotransferase
MKFNVVCGMPRSASTLLQNCLQQNPRFHASSTSCLAQTVRSLSGLWSRSPEIKSDLIADKEGTEARMVRSARALIEAWYQDTAEVVFDKGRFWNLGIPLFHQLFPEGHAFVCVRDLRAIFASIEKQHDKNPMLDEAGNPVELTKFNRADRMFGPNGMLGQQIMGIEDLLRRNLRNADGKPFVHPIQYETFVQNPQLVIDRIYTAIGEEPFEHDFENVQNTAGEKEGGDAIYNWKFPHEGEGKIEPRPDDWQEYVPPDIAQLIMQKFVNYNRAFGYQ